MKLRYIVALVAAGIFSLGPVDFASQAFAADDDWEELENWANTWSSEQQQEPPQVREIPRVPQPVTESPAEEKMPEEPSAAAPVPQRPARRIVRPAAMAPGPANQETETRRAPSPGSPSSSVAPSTTVPLPTVTPSGSKLSVRRSVPARRREPEAPKKPEKNFFAEHFFMTPDQKLLYQTSELGGFVFVESSGPGGIPEYSVVTDFGGNVVQTQRVAGVTELQQARTWIRDSMETSTFEGVEVRKLKVPVGADQTAEYYWVGQKAFSSADQAFAEIAMIQSAAEVSGGDFSRMVSEAQTYAAIPEEKPIIEIPAPADFEKQERLILKMLDAMDVGNKLLGPFTGETSGEKIIWQSFSETSWRRTNLESFDYSELTGFWTNRIVLKGIRAPLSTIDPFLESTIAMESDGTDFKDTMKLWAGLEWRPLSTNPWFYNYRPWSLPLLEWVRNYRFYVMYGNRINLKDEIAGSDNHDLHAGVQIFYEFGIDLPAAAEGGPSTFADYLRKYVWGEYFGNYRYEMTGFSAEDDFDSILLNSNILLGFRLPAIPLPSNPINDELVLMPYMRFEHVNSSEFSFPFQNQYFVAAGVRWMPFRTYRFKENEWLSKVKLFGEYVGVGKVQHAKQDGEAPDAIRYDLRFGLNISSRRF